MKSPQFYINFRSFSRNFAAMIHHDTVKMKASLGVMVNFTKQNWSRGVGDKAGGIQPFPSISVGGGGQKRHAIIVILLDFLDGSKPGGAGGLTPMVVWQFYEYYYQVLLLCLYATFLGIPTPGYEESRCSQFAVGRIIFQAPRQNVIARTTTGPCWMGWVVRT